ncbi:carbamoyltransferase HypF [Clostridium aminobutyricum]|uniref:Carbamoyltransferase n=1 Tax=Clostridium aminobutyricum TaxID=33953 RepID=A0A939IJU9_CLOAM|nr:carbamoyltransferase HypF [Clostridium aminobutyricum]MBN7773968.1 carbamoyltransferase HypF [Clostridium aminobutyricum]
MSERPNYLVQIWGLVQGVGMRPFIYKTAKSFDITGFVKNQGASVMMHISGKKEDITGFVHMLTHHPPQNARIEKIQKLSIESEDYQDFRIITSSADQNHLGLLLPDLALCEDCMRDVKTSKDRHFKYAFTNCTNCGPRYSIIDELPYDRKNTSMEPFQMCPQCETEYKNPEDRRFHAQPVCCPHCGPQYQLYDRSGNLIPCEDPIKKVKQLFKKGKIVAVKGIGGYHLVCNAMNKGTIELLRQRKKRPDRPFAVMASTIEAVKEICMVSDAEEETISSNKRPIVLLNKRKVSMLPESVAPGLIRYGVMLPYSALHYFIFDHSLQYLIMTSGNISGMPICYKDRDALSQLNNVADYFLMHNREIRTPIDDSVVKVIHGDTLISRCGRGYAPAALPIDSTATILAVGGQQKASICMLHKGYAHVSQYLNTLNNMESFNEYKQVIDRFSRLLKAEAQFVGHDLSSDNFSTRYAKQLPINKVAIQHHHAHMAGCMAEHQLSNEVLGIIFDGTGMGTDGTVWGGEFLIGTRSTFERVGHLEYVAIQGGEAAIKEPWRTAASYLYSLNCDIASLFPTVDRKDIEIVTKALQHNINCFISSSMGRLFDCIAALILGRTHITYDAQAAIELESILDPSVLDYYAFTVQEGNNEEPLLIGYGDIIKGVLADLNNGIPVPSISAKFHNTLCKATIRCAIKIRERYQINDVILSGGVFENTYFFKNILSELREYSFNVYFNKQMPLNDGGLSFGQAAAAASMIGRESYVSGNSGDDYIRTR